MVVIRIEGKALQELTKAHNDFMLTLGEVCTLQEFAAQLYLNGLVDIQAANNTLKQADAEIFKALGAACVH